MSSCWRGSPVGSTSVCFHKGLIFIMHYAPLKKSPHPHPSSIYQNLQEGALARTVGGKEKLGRIEAVRSCIPEKKRGKMQKKISLRGRQWVLRDEAAVFLFLMTALLITVTNQENLGSRVNKSRWAEDKVVSLGDGRSGNDKLSKAKI